MKCTHPPCHQCHNELEVVKAELRALHQEHDEAQIQLGIVVAVGTMQRDVIEDLRTQLAALETDNDAAEERALEAENKLEEISLLVGGEGTHEKDISTVTLVSQALEALDKENVALSTQLAAAQAELEQLRAFKAQWDEKDGNTPGYNLDKAKVYGARAQSEKERADAAEAQVQRLRGALEAFSRQASFPRAHSLGCLCDGMDEDGTTCRSRHETARAALADTDGGGT